MCLTRTCQVLIVDDDPSMRSALRRALRSPHYQIALAPDGLRALQVLDAQPPGTFAAAILDLRMPGMDGLQVLNAIKRRSPDTQVVLLTGHGSVPLAVQAMRLGADDFLEKPFEPDALRERIWTAVRVWAARRAGRSATGQEGRRDLTGSSERSELCGPANAPPPAEDAADPVAAHLIGQSRAMQEIRGLARRLADSDATLLIQGETGTGKEQFARAVHYVGRRADQPLVIVDASALSATVIESELFGHVKGAFTGAHTSRPGLLRAAGRGTVFLDEIADLPGELQTRLLRVLQDRKVRPVGSESSFPVEARFVAATSKDLAKAVARGQFRADLYHRLNVATVTMPPLREYKEDIEHLARHFLRKYRQERPGVRDISDAALAALLAYDWPGNIRELENVILRGLVMGSSELIELKDLPGRIAATATRNSPPTTSLSASVGGWDRDGSSEETLAACERRAVELALARAGGNRARAAATLGIGVATLYRKLKKYRLT